MAMIIKNMALCSNILLLTFFWFAQSLTNVIIPPYEHDSKTVYIFAHGLGGNHRQTYYYAKELSILNWPLVMFNFPDVKNDSSAVDRKKVNLGQELDIATLKNAYDHATSHFPRYPIVLVGVSRGAATILNFLATGEYPNIAAAVVESPFDTLDTIMEYQLRMFKLTWLHTPCMAFARLVWFPLVDMNGTFPLNSVQKIRPNLPILFIHSQEDELIPTKCSQRLYQELVATGNPHIHYVELAQGKHARVINGVNGHLFHQAVHAFYKKYHLPHENHVALLGESLLAKPLMQSTSLKA